MVRPVSAATGFHRKETAGNSVALTSTLFAVMKKLFRKLLKVWVITKLNYPEEYVKTAAKSRANVDISTLTHAQIAALRTSLKSLEADLIINIAFNSPTTTVKDVDISVFNCE